MAVLSIFLLFFMMPKCESSGLPCSALEFHCVSGECIDLYKLCDGDKDCSDGSDEIKCGNRSNLAHPLLFRCKNGQLTWGAWRCDGKDNCKDRSDEQNCVKGRCNNFQYRCNDGKCIGGFYVCDGKRHCDDWSDEDEILCNNYKGKCTPWRFRCASDGKCVDGVLRCGFHFDCADSSDEVNCKARSFKRSNFRGNSDCNLKRWWNFDCENGCYKTENICDGTNDCRTTRIDETSCGIQSSGQCGFQCDSGLCVPKSARCDGNLDCPDASDEWGCAKNCNRHPSGVKCEKMEAVKNQESTTCICLNSCRPLTITCLENGRWSDSTFQCSTPYYNLEIATSNAGKVIVSYAPETPLSAIATLRTMCTPGIQTIRPGLVSCKDGNLVVLQPPVCGNNTLLDEIISPSYDNTNTTTDTNASSTEVNIGVESNSALSETKLIIISASSLLALVCVLCAVYFIAKKSRRSQVTPQADEVLYDDIDLSKIYPEPELPPRLPQASGYLGVLEANQYEVPIAWKLPKTTAGKNANQKGLSITESDEDIYEKVL